MSCLYWSRTTMLLARRMRHLLWELIYFRIEAAFHIHLFSNLGPPFLFFMARSTMKPIKLLLFRFVLSITRHDSWHKIDLRVKSIVLLLGYNPWFRRWLDWHVIINARLKSQSTLLLLTQFLSKLIDFNLSVFVLSKKSINYVVYSILFGHLCWFWINARLKRAGRYFCLCKCLFMLHLLLDNLFQSKVKGIQIELFTI